MDIKNEEEDPAALSSCWIPHLCRQFDNGEDYYQFSGPCSPVAGFLAESHAHHINHEVETTTPQLTSDASINKHPSNPHVPKQRNSRRTPSSSSLHPVQSEVVASTAADNNNLDYSSAFCYDDRDSSPTLTSLLCSPSNKMPTLQSSSTTNSNSTGTHHHHHHQHLTREERRRRRRATQKYRAAHASRERVRVEAFNSSFGHLRKLLPTLPPDKKLSKIEILRLAICYIAYLNHVLES